MPSIVTIHNTPGFHVDSHGNGFAYAINFGAAPGPYRTFWVQGETALEVREHVERLETEDPDRDFSEIWASALDEVGVLE